MSLCTKILDAKDYLEEYSVLETDENQKILDLIISWLSRLEKEIVEEIIFPFYHHPEFLGKWDDKYVTDLIDEKSQLFLSIVQNFKYIPIQPPIGG